MRTEADIRALVTGDYELSRRENRWLALFDDRVVFIADDDASRRRLDAVAWLLDRWRKAGIPAPRVLATNGPAQTRERMHGLIGDEIHCEIDRSPLYVGPVPDARARMISAPLTPFGERVARSYGELAARIRRAVSVDDARAAGFREVTTRRSLDVDKAIAALLHTSASQPAKDAAVRLREWLVRLPPVDAVIHADLHFFNMCCDASGAIVGVFDVGDAGIDAAATELLYVHSLGAEFLATVLDAYGEVNLDDVRHAHLRVVLDHVLTHGPGTPRHESITRWATAAFEALG